MKIAFIHLMKTAGSTVHAAMSRGALRPFRYLQLNPWHYRDSDWTKDELQEFLRWKQDYLYVHNHAGNWPAEVVREYLRAGWFTFTFYRHPGDQWCSYYFWSQLPNEIRLKKQRAGQPKPITFELSLDEFLQLAWTDYSDSLSLFKKNAIAGLRRNLDLPDWWHELSYVGVFSNENFKKFGTKYFGDRSWLIKHDNASPNRGYEHYRRRGLISDETDRLLTSSQRYLDYQRLLEAPHENGQEHFLAAKNNVFLSRRPSIPDPVRYVVLAPAPSQFLIDCLKDHRAIHAFGEEFDTFPRKWACQKKWLSEFYVGLPKKNRLIRVLGFNTKLSSVADQKRFRKFIERNGIRVIHLDRTNPVKSAISELSARRAIEEAGNSSSGDKQSEVRISIPEFRSALGCQKATCELREFVSGLNVPTLHLQYEELLRDEVAALKEVWMFLGVAPVERKQARLRDNLRQTVVNLDELRSAFPEYEQHFSDE